MKLYPIIFFATLASICFFANGRKISSGSPRIVGGEVVDPYAIPWQVSIKRKKLIGSEYNLHCSGVVISDTWILTVADCQLDPSKDIVVAGEFSISIEEESEQVRDILRVENHPDFGVFNKFDMDFALVELSNPLTLDGEIVATGLRPNPNETYASGNAVVSGWGATSDGGSLSDFLRAVTVPIVSQASCSATYDDVTDNMICAGEKGKDSCSGDSGGPLMFEDMSGSIIGLVSWGYHCAFEGYPGVYARVTSALEWIDETCGNCWN